jgi:nicotinic acid mononucleotide adenylyltransferase
VIDLTFEVSKAELPDLQRDLQAFGGATLRHDTSYATLGVKARYFCTVGEDFLESFPRWKAHRII